MTSSTDNSKIPEGFHSNLEVDVANRYRAQGFTVTAQPSKEAIPFDLGSYTPDLIATKPPDESLIIEVKGSTHNLSVDRFREIADIVSQNPGWRFLLVTGDDSTTVDQMSKLLTWSQIQSRVHQSLTLIDAGEAEPAFIYLWGTLEAALRRRAIQVAIPVERFASQSIINHLYSQGELSREQFHTAKEMYAIRSKVVHGFDVSNLEEPARSLHSLISELLEEWI
jgi:REase_AHJR-like